MAKKKLYAVCVQLSDGALFTEVALARSAGHAFEVIMEQHFDGSEPDCEWFMIRPEQEEETKKPAKKKAPPQDTKPRKTSKKPEVISAKPLTEAQKHRAAKAVQRLIEDGVDESALSTVIEAYALGVAEGP